MLGGILPTFLVTLGLATLDCTTHTKWDQNVRSNHLVQSRPDLLDSNTSTLRRAQSKPSKLTSQPRLNLSEISLEGFFRLASPYLRLARLHTVMAWAIFPAPALYTAILFHATQLPDMNPQAKIASCLRTCTALFLSVMSYRAAGLAWDDLIDREYDAKVTRSKSRPLPAGDLTMDCALLWIAVLTGFTVLLIQSLLAPEVFLCFFLSATLFVIYPFLKLFGAFLISMGVIQAWVACAAVHAPATGAGSGWTHVIAIVYRDSKKIGSVFLMEYLYEVAHELIYGCQDTKEDIEIGLFSLSILCGYKMSWVLGIILVSGFTSLVGYCAIAAALPIWPLPVVPAVWLLSKFSGLDLAIPASCGTWASRAIKVKVSVTVAFALLFLLKELGLPSWSMWSTKL